MAELSRDGDELVLTLSALEQAESIHGDIRVPASSVRAVEILEDVIHAVHGLRLPGTAWPGKVAVGTFYTQGTKTFAVVHHDTPRGLRVRLDGTLFDEFVIGCEDPEALQRRITES